MYTEMKALPKIKKLMTDLVYQPMEFLFPSPEAVWCRVHTLHTKGSRIQASWMWLRGCERQGMKENALSSGQKSYGALDARAPSISSEKGQILRSPFLLVH